MQRKSSPEELREQFNRDVERFVNLEMGQTSTMDSKLAIDFADGVIQGSETIHPDILQYIATKPNTPFLPYQSPETYIDEFNKFYDVVLESK